MLDTPNNRIAETDGQEQVGWLSMLRRGAASHRADKPKHLYLPYFNEDTVKDVVEALQNSEGGEIPADIVGESTARKKFDTLTVKFRKMRQSTPYPG